jgi:TRAP-type C4-dicarboxylate transport system permease small subunit
MSNIDSTTGASEVPSREPGDEIIKVLTWLSRTAVWLGGLGILFSAFLVTVEIIVRKFFGSSLGGADEISGYIFAISTVWAMPFALLNRANVRVDVVYILLPRWLRSVLDVFGLALLLGFMSFVAWHSWNLFWGNYLQDTRSITPLQARVWVPQGIWVLGMFLFLFVGIILFLMALAALMRARWARVGTLVGSRSSEEEIQAEVATLELAELGDPRAPDERPHNGSNDGGGD